MKLPDDFKEFLRLLRDNDVEYLLIGGYAVAYHGHIRATGDMDIWFRATQENATRMVNVLDAFGFGVAGLTAARLLEPKRIVRMGNPPLRLELMTSIDGVDFDECFEGGQEVLFEDQPVRVIALADLRKNKAASGRHKDLDDLENLPQV